MGRRRRAATAHPSKLAPTSHAAPSLDGGLGNQGLLDQLKGNGSNLPEGCLHTVEKGDNLWNLSKEYLGGSKGWPGLYQRNKGTIGNDPNLILPGQDLNICPAPKEEEQECSPEPQVCEKEFFPEDPDDGNPLTMEKYLAALKVVEARFKATQKENGGDDSTAAFNAAMRATYGYEGGSWEKMIEGAPDIPKLDLAKYPELAPYFDVDEDGKTSSKEVTLPDGSVVDPGHVYTGIGAYLHPNANRALRLAGIRNQDGATWSGDVGSAIVHHDEMKGKLSYKQAFDEMAGKGDLNADLDGVNIGANLDRSKSLTEQLSAYYSEDAGKGKGYRHRFSQFTQNRGLSTENGKLTKDAKGIIDSEVDDFADLYAHRDDGWLGRVKGGLFGDYDQDSDRSQAMTGQFVDYLNNGLANEPE